MSAQIEKVRDEMFDLIGHISYQDFTDLDTYWGSLADALQGLSFKDGIEVKKAKSVADALRQIATSSGENLTALAKLAQEMEELSDGGSHDVIDEEDAEKLESLVGDFEVDFEKFLDDQLPAMLADEN